MDADDLRLLLDYHYWARDRVLEAAAALTPEQFARDLGSSFRSVRDTLGHLVGAEQVWLSRWTGNALRAMPPPDQFADFAAVRAAWAALETRVRAFAAALGTDFGRVFTYQSFAGHAMNSPFWQMLQHLVNHGSYHRGQVTTLLRQLGAPAGRSMDLIAFYRERAG